MDRSMLSNIEPYWLAARGKLEWVIEQVPMSNIIMVLGLLSYALMKFLNTKARYISKLEKEKLRQEREPSVFSPPIEPLKNFDWRTTAPLQIRPFKAKYHLTMGLGNMEPSQLIPMDNTYKDRIMYRRTLFKEHRDIVLGIDNDHTDFRVRAAVAELFLFVMGNYLPTRYPTMFKLVDAKFGNETVQMLQNLVTGELLPIVLSPDRSAASAMETLGKTVDEDMLVLLPELKGGKANEPNEKQGATASKLGDTKYVLRAYQTCCPSGFDTSQKLGKRLASIHEPVPGYREKLEQSMDRYFEKLEVGKFVQRANWSVTTGADLFSPSGIHAEENEDLEPLKLEELDLDDTYLRCERQTLYRLPQSGAIVFSFHTYRYPIQEIKEDGSGEELAIAIDGLAAGNVPGMAKYKRQAAWGSAVKEFLRS